MEKKIYDRNQIKLDKKIDDNTKNIKIKTNLVKKYKNKINEFYNKIAIKIR